MNERSVFRVTVTGRGIPRTRSARHSLLRDQPTSELCLSDRVTGKLTEGEPLLRGERAVEQLINGRLLLISLGGCPARTLIKHAPSERECFPDLPAVLTSNAVAFTAPYRFIETTRAFRKKEPISKMTIFDTDCAGDLMFHSGVADDTQRDHVKYCSPFWDIVSGPFRLSVTSFLRM